MTALKPEYLKSLQQDPQRSVNAIVKTTTDPASNVDRITVLGLTVTRTFSLIFALAVTGPAQAVIGLAVEPWVVSIEPDQPVHTME
jgi:hypothetical protein